MLLRASLGASAALVLGLVTLAACSGAEPGDPIAEPDDAAVTLDGGATADAAPRADASPIPDASPSTDGAATEDAAPSTLDASAAVDAAAAIDATAPGDAGTGIDAAAPGDAGTGIDASPADAGRDTGPQTDACAAESEAQLQARTCTAGLCGTRTARDACGTFRNVDCGAVCSTPPAPICATTTSVRIYGASGTCAAGSCYYAWTTSPCAAATCANGVARAASTCSGGACLPGAQTTCTWGCNGAVCAADPCASTTCATPPSPTCVNTTTRRTFGATGTCSNATGSAVCTYAPTDAACGLGEACSSGACRPAISPQEITATSAGFTGPGLDNCGTTSDDNCARSLLVPGGTFARGTNTAYPATISGFRLDKYEITVGRFRKFVDAWVGGWRPAPGAGRHTHVNGGNGLASYFNAYDTGWNASWTAYVGAASSASAYPTTPGAVSKSDWDLQLRCSPLFETWTITPGPTDNRPQSCLNWYDVHAFCIWDGGFIPSEAEWEYAAAGGSEERTYPWGATPPTTGLAVYRIGSTTSPASPVGSLPAGNGRWGHTDLAGGIEEWGLDWYANTWMSPCTDCAVWETPISTLSATRVTRGGSFGLPESALPAATRAARRPAERPYVTGGRCARLP
jgi:formylglycine-generating enzyme required for sulfatase activity